MSIFEDPQPALLRSPVFGVVVGQFLGINQEGYPLVGFPGQETNAAVAARTIAPMHHAPFGAEVLLQFEQGDVSKPIILGVIQQPQTTTREIAGHSLEVDADGQCLQIRAREQLVLRCGEASITLTRAGKVLINGLYVSSRAKGTHRIRGGNVQIN